MQQPIREDARALQPVAESLRNGAQIFADDEAAIADRLQGDDCEQVGDRIAHVCTGVGQAVARNPEQPLQRPITWSMRSAPA